MPAPKHELLPQLPAWHNTMFRDSHSNTDYSPSLIRAGFITVQQLERLTAQVVLPRTWSHVYQLGSETMAQLAMRRDNPSPQEISPSFWLEWNTRVKLRYLSSLMPEPPSNSQRYGKCGQHCAPPRATSFSCKWHYGPNYLWESDWQNGSHLAPDAQ